MAHEGVSGCTEALYAEADPETFSSHQKSLKSGVGFGLRHQHFKQFREAITKSSMNPAINWLEVHPENYVTFGTSLEVLAELAQSYNLSYHGVGLSLGSPWDEESQKHLNRIVNLIKHLPCNSFSEHISWSKHEMRHSHDLLPILYNNESLQIIADNINRVQNALGEPIAVENPSIYTKLPHKYTETEFISKILYKTGCNLLLDINNIEVCAFNLGYSMEGYLSEIDLSKVREIHIAGHTSRKVNSKIMKIDTHSRCASSNVWKHLRAVLANENFKGFVMYEWDEDLPEFEDFMNEVQNLAKLYRGIVKVT